MPRDEELMKYLCGTGGAIDETKMRGLYNYSAALRAEFDPLGGFDIFAAHCRRLAATAARDRRLADRQSARRRQWQMPAG